MSNYKELPPDFVRDVIDPGWREREAKSRAFWNSVSARMPTGSPANALHVTEVCERDSDSYGYCSKCGAADNEGCKL